MIRKPPLAKAQTALKNNKNNIWRKTILNIYTTLFTVQRTAATKQLKKKKRKKKKEKTWRMELLHQHCGTIMTLISPGDYVDFQDFQCGMWLWNHDSEFNKWQHPAVWYVALGWHAMEFAQSSKRPPYWNSKSCFDFDHITAVDMSFCTSLRNFIQIGPPSAKKWRIDRFSRRRILSHLGF